MLRKLRTESYKKGVLFSVLFSAFAKLLAFASSAVIAFYFGAGAETDVYFFAILVTSSLAYYVTGLNSAVLIPEYMHLRETSGDIAGEKFLNFFVLLYGCLGAATAAALIARPVTGFSFFSRFPAELLAGHTGMLVGAAVLLPLMLFCILLTDILTSRKFFTMPMFTNMLNSLFTLAFLFIFHERMGLASAMLGLLAAWSVQALLLVYMMKSVFGWNFSAVGGLPERRILKNIFYSQVGNATAFFASVLPLTLLSGLGHGVVSALNYGRQAAELPNMLVTNQVSSVLGIRLNELQSKKDEVGTARVFSDTVRHMVFLVTPVSVLFFFMSRETITLLFARGSFDASSIELSAGFLKLLALLLPMTAISTAIARLFLSGRVRQSFWAQTVIGVALAAMIWACVRERGPMGYPEALLMVTAGCMFFYIWFVKKFFPRIEYSGLLVYCAGVGLVDLALYPPAAFLCRRVFDAGAAGFIATGAGYFALIGVVNLFLRQNGELADLMVRSFPFLGKIYGIRAARNAVENQK